MTAPVSVLGSEPTCTARVPKPSMEVCSLMAWISSAVLAWPLCVACSPLRLTGDIPDMGVV